jgi:hypothetical protein
VAPSEAMVSEELSPCAVNRAYTNPVPFPPQLSGPLEWLAGGHARHS